MGKIKIKKDRTLADLIIMAGGPEEFVRKQQERLTAFPDDDGDDEFALQYQRDHFVPNAQLDDDDLLVIGNKREPQNLAGTGTCLLCNLPFQKGGDRLHTCQRCRKNQLDREIDENREDVEPEAGEDAMVDLLEEAG